MRIHFILPGLHRVHRGAEVAFESIATEIANLGFDEVTVVGTARVFGIVPRSRGNAQTYTCECSRH